MNRPNQQFQHIKLLKYRLFCTGESCLKTCIKKLQTDTLAKGANEGQVRYLLDYCQRCNPGLSAGPV